MRAASRHELFDDGRLGSEAIYVRRLTVTLRPAVVIPAKAGTQLLPGSPAFAGMTIGTAVR
jgi:hypothetical protein